MPPRSGTRATGTTGDRGLWIDTRIAWALVEDLVLTSYRRVAPKRALEKLDEHGQFAV